MGSRLALNAIFKSIPGVAEVYFQPPTNVSMVYPCIRYNLSDVRTDHAGNLPYSSINRYQVVLLDRNPDSPIRAVLDQMPKKRFDRFYEADGLNHFVYEIYF